MGEPVQAIGSRLLWREAFGASVLQHGRKRVRVHQEQARGGFNVGGLSGRRFRGVRELVAQLAQRMGEIGQVGGDFPVRGQTFYPCIECPRFILKQVLRRDVQSLAKHQARFFVMLAVVLPTRFFKRCFNPFRKVFDFIGHGGLGPNFQNIHRRFFAVYRESVSKRPSVCWVRTQHNDTKAAIRALNKQTALYPCLHSFRWDIAYSDNIARLFLASAMGTIKGDLNRGHE